MALSALAWAGLGWWTASTALHWATAILAGQRRPLPDRLSAVSHSPADFSIVAPMSGAADVSVAYVQALMALAGAGAEVLICVAAEDDGAAAPLRELWPDAPILVGNDTTFNPKMNNVRKGLEAASRPLVALCDAGILLDAENLRRAALPLSGSVGLVLALKAGEAPGNFAAELERSYIDCQQARFLFAADRVGITVASGGVTLMSRETLERIGNWRGFNRWIADDYSVTRSVREIGLKTTLGDFMVRLPLGTRDWPVVWRRQVRWARTRMHLPVWPLVLWEPAVGWLFSGIVGASGLIGAGVSTEIVVTCVAAHSLLWLAAEKWFMSRHGLAFGWRAAAATLVREGLAPALMVSALSSRAILWRGTDLGGQWRDSGERSSGAHNDGDEKPAQPVSNAMDMSRDIEIVNLPDCVDSTTAEAIEQSILARIAPGSRLIVDAADVTYMGAAGVRALAGVLHRAETVGARLVFCRFSGPAADCLVVSGFSKLLDVAESLEEARLQLQSGLLADRAERLHARGTAG
jgi:ceramide glucosyltransferase